MYKTLVLIILNMLVLLVTFFATALSREGTAFQSPLPTPPAIITPSPVIGENFTFTITQFDTVELAYSNFVAGFKGAEVRPFLDSEKLNTLGFKGYHTWYSGTLTTHTFVLPDNGTWVITFQNTDPKVLNNELLRLLTVEPFVIDMLLKIKGQSALDGDFR